MRKSILYKRSIKKIITNKIRLFYKLYFIVFSRKQKSTKSNNIYNTIERLLVRHAEIIYL